MQRGIAYRRNERTKKIKYRKTLCEKHYGFAWYEFDGCYSKGKIHCGCGICKPYRKFYPSLRDLRKIEIAKTEMKEYI